MPFGILRYSVKSFLVDKKCQKMSFYISNFQNWAKGFLAPKCPPKVLQRSLKYILIGQRRSKGPTGNILTETQNSVPESLIFEIFQCLNWPHSTFRASRIVKIANLPKLILQKILKFPHCAAIDEVVQRIFQKFSSKMTCHPQCVYFSSHVANAMAVTHF